MRLTIRGLILAASFVVAPCAFADSASSVFTQAVAQGQSSAPLSNDGQFKDAIAAIKKRTGSNGPVVLYASRIVTFEHQPHCGRVAFMIAQPDAHAAFRDMSGQMNICDNGDPPRRICKADPDKLVSPDGICADLSKPVDAPEVAAAIADAVAHGGMTPQQAAAMMREGKTRAVPTAGGKS